jgi:hypothetical protein
MLLFTPLILTCLVEEPTQCRPIMGPAETTEVACMTSLSGAMTYVSTLPDVYAAGLACLETYILDDPA